MQQTGSTWHGELLCSGGDVVALANLGHHFPKKIKIRTSNKDGPWPTEDRGSIYKLSLRGEITQNLWSYYNLNKQKQPETRPKEGNVYQCK